MSQPLSSAIPARRLVVVDDRRAAPTGVLEQLAAEPLAGLGLITVHATSAADAEAALGQPDCEAVVVLWPPRSTDVPRLLAAAIQQHPGLVIVAVAADPAADADAAAARAAIEAGAGVCLPASQHGVLGLVLARKVTERRRLDAALRREALILASAGEGIYGVDTTGAVTFANPVAARLIGWKAEDLLGKNQHAVLHHTRPDGTPYPREQCPIYAAFSDGQVHHVDTELFFRKDGTSFPVDYISTPIRDGRRLTGAVVTFRDITERKAAEAARSRHARQLEALVASLSQLIATEDMVLASQSLAAALVPARAAVDRLARGASPETLAVELGKVRALFDTLQHLASDAAPPGETCDLAVELPRAVAPRTVQKPASGRVEARVAPEDLRVAVEQLASLVGPSPERAVSLDDGVPTVRVEGASLGPEGTGVALLFARRLIGRNLGALETLRRSDGRVAYLARLAPGSAPAEGPIGR